MFLFQFYFSGEPMTPRELLKLGFQYFAQRDYERAVCYFKKALDMDDTFIAAYSALVETYNRMGAINQALEIVKKWLELDENNARVHAMLSRIYVQLGQIELAKKEWAVANALSVKQN